MKTIPIALLAALLVAACSAPERKAAPPGAVGFEPADLQGWRAASTGPGAADAKWESKQDAKAPSPPNVLALVATNHDSEDRFNLFWNDGMRFGDGNLSVEVRADEGEVDQGGGIAWRVQDANNYYICRFNPLEANYRVYVVKDGVRRQLATALVEVQAGEWHRLDVEHVGDRITCSLDGKPTLEARDATIPGAGGVALWTKADARTSFDNLSVQSAGG